MAIDSGKLSSATIPEHVPAELVREFPLSQFAPTKDDPFDVLIPQIHAGPDIFFAPRASAMGDGAWVLRRAEDIRAAFLDDEHLSVSGATRVSRLIGEEWDMIPVQIDPPDHTWYRALLNPLFSPRRMAALDADVRSQAAHLIEKFKDRGECDFMRDFAVPFPVGVFLRLLGLSLDEMDRYIEWEHMLVHNPDFSVKGIAMEHIRDCLVAALDKRRARPADDVLSHLATAELNGRRLTETEQMRTALTLFMAGLDTVTTTFGWQVKYLAGAPAAQQRLRSEPGLIATASEELARAFAPVSVNRICVKSFVTPQGVTIKEGDQVLLSTPLAARDPEAYERPNDIILDRNPTHITFAYGIHRCLGSHLARRELQIGLEELLASLPPFRRADDVPLPMYFGIVLGLEKLPLVWN